MLRAKSRPLAVNHLIGYELSQAIQMGRRHGYYCTATHELVSLVIASARCWLTQLLSTDLQVNAVSSARRRRRSIHHFAEDGVLLHETSADLSGQGNNFRGGQT